MDYARQFRLDGRVALVTGAAGGLVRAMQPGGAAGRGGSIVNVSSVAAMSARSPPRVSASIPCIPPS